MCAQSNVLKKKSNSTNSLITLRNNSCLERNDNEINHTNVIPVLIISKNEKKYSIYIVFFFGLP